MNYTETATIKQPREASYKEAQKAQNQWRDFVSSMPLRLLIQLCFYDLADNAAVGVFTGEGELGGFHHLAHVLH